MKTFIVTRGVPNQNNSSLGVFEFDQAKALAAVGCEVVVLSLDLRSFRRKRNLGYHSYIIDGIPVEELNIPIGAVPRAILVKIGTITLKWLINKAKKKHGKPDIIHSHFLNICDMASRATAGRYTHVITEHSSMLNTNLSAKQVSSFKSIYESADLVIAVSSALCCRMNELFSINPICISNIVDTAVFRYFDKKNVKKSGDFKFITVANLTKNKRIDLLLSAIKRLKEEGYSVKLTVIGDGEMRPPLEEQIQSLGISNHIELLGKLERNRVNVYLKDSDCFVLDSMSETFGVAYIEAIATGLPVIASKCGGPEDFVNDSNGILIEKDNLDQLTNAMKYMLTNAKKYNHEQISKHIAEKFSAETIAKKIMSEYEKLISK